jgi:hypothetical protein
MVAHVYVVYMLLVQEASDLSPELPWVYQTFCAPNPDWDSVDIYR